MAAISQTTLSNAFSWMKMLEFRYKFHTSFVPKGPINNIPALIQIMAWHLPGDKPLSESMIVSLLTHIRVTRPQWVKSKSRLSGYIISTQIKTVAQIVNCTNDIYYVDSAVDAIQLILGLYLLYCIVASCYVRFTSCLMHYTRCCFHLCYNCAQGYQTWTDFTSYISATFTASFCR